VRDGARLFSDMETDPPNAPLIFGSRFRSAAPPVVQVPDHELCRRIGCGSYGEVWLARNAMGVFRAVKIVFADTFESRRPFEREFEGLKNFEPFSRSHEGLVDILHVGRSGDDYFYYVMELADHIHPEAEFSPECYEPRTVSREIVARGKLGVDECVKMGLVLSGALAHLHEQGYVHRDIKPSNILFINSTPKLADIGLVASIGEARSYVGTEGYIPPEGPNSRQADIYSLGKVLYETCTGKDRKDYPALPADFVDSAERARFLELNEILLKACHHDARSRYPSAEELTADLLLLQSGKSIKRLNLLERKIRILKIAAVYVLGGILVGSGLWHQVNRERAREAMFKQRQAGTQVAHGTHAMENGHFLGALPYFVEALRLDAGQPAREKMHRLRIGATLARAPRLVQMWFFEGPVVDAGFSKDGGTIWIAQWYGEVQVKDLISGETVSPPFGRGKEYGLKAASMASSGKYGLTSNFDKTARVWDAESGEEILVIPHPEAVHSARFNSRGDRILTACEDGKARIFEFPPGGPPLILSGHGKGIHEAVFSPDERLIATAGKDDCIRIWDVMEGKAVGERLAHTSWVMDLSFSPDGSRVITGSFDRKILIWDLDSGQMVHPVMGHGDSLSSVGFSPDGKLALSGSWDSTARLWDVERRRLLEVNHTFPHSGRVMKAVFCPEGRRVATVCWDGSVRIWDLAGAIYKPEEAGKVFSADGSRFWTTSHGRVEIFDAARNELLARLAPSHPVETVFFHRNGRHAATISSRQESAGDERVIQSWNLSSGESVGSIFLADDAVEEIWLSELGEELCVYAKGFLQRHNFLTRESVHFDLGEGSQVARFSPDGKQIALGKGSKVEVWSTLEGKRMYAEIPMESNAQWIDFSPDGSKFLVACLDDQLYERGVHLFESKRGAPMGRSMRHRDGVNYAVFSPDGNFVATASEDFTAAVWDAHTGARVSPMLLHQNQVRHAAFNQSGAWVATGSWDKTARVWDARTGEPLTPPLLHDHVVVRVQFVGDGNWLWTAGARGEAWLWELGQDARPVKDLALQANLLSGGKAGETDWAKAPQTREIEFIWKFLKGEYPEAFSVGPEKIKAWQTRR
jgi:eukaryotic-like serine/threonine-protein kinase